MFPEETYKNFLIALAQAALRCFHFYRGANVRVLLGNSSNHAMFKRSQQRIRIACRELKIQPTQNCTLGKMLCLIRIEEIHTFRQLRLSHNWHRFVACVYDFFQHTRSSTFGGSTRFLAL